MTCFADVSMECENTQHSLTLPGSGLVLAGPPFILAELGCWGNPGHCAGRRRYFWRFGKQTLLCLDDKVEPFFYDVRSLNLVKQNGFIILPVKIIFTIFHSVAYILCNDTFQKI